ncbi:hypothetical protein [Pararhizobium sp. DWP1-1-3]|uniref:hypothetical protein n=1 Tax=Pararhizobium sp. DWP1-1-3 TaxID=2804652 RepID=UPI003CEEE459
MTIFLYAGRNCFVTRHKRMRNAGCANVINEFQRSVLAATQHEIYAYKTANSMCSSSVGQNACDGLT